MTNTSGKNDEAADFGTMIDDAIKRERGRRRDMMLNADGTVTVSSEVGETLVAITQKYHPEEIIEMRAMGTPYDYPAIKNIPLDTLIRALYIGYEVEPTPEEKVADILAQLDDMANDYRYHFDNREKYENQAKIVREVLNILGVKLPKGD